MSALDISARAGWKAYAAAEQAWSRLWFQERPTTPLELARIGIGAALLLHYLSASSYLLEFWGDAGLLPRALALPRCGPVDAICFLLLHRAMAMDRL